MLILTCIVAEAGLLQQQISFLCLPSVSSVAFAAFECEEFDHGSFLKADYAIDCASGEYRTVVAWAVASLLLPQFLAMSSSAEPALKSTSVSMTPGVRSNTPFT